VAEVLLLKDSIEWGYDCNQPEMQAFVCLLGYADTVSYVMELCVSVTIETLEKVKEIKLILL
jgi:hypothetical protein